MDKKEIITRLSQGESLDAILAELTQTITEANNEYTASQKAVQEKESRLNELMATLLSTATEYLHLAHPEVEVEEITVAEAREKIAELAPVLNMFKNIKVHYATTAPKVKNKAKSAADTFLDTFLREMNW